MEPEGNPFALLVSLLGGRPARYVFDQDKVLVGRGLEADLRIEHAGLSRSQFLIERGRGSAGEPRFRITPYDTTNGTFVNERPAVEGTLTPGDVISVAEVRVVLERKVPKTARPSAQKEQISPLRMALLGAVTLMALFVCYLLFAGDPAPDAGDIAGTQVQMFLGPPQVTCANPIECDTRAHEAYARGKALLEQAGADPGNLYRATLELEKAARFRDLSGRPLADMADAAAQADQARSRAESAFQDARFQLSRAIATNDLRRQAAEAALLARILPDDRHPYRIKLDAYRRTLPKPPDPEPGAAQ